MPDLSAIAAVLGLAVLAVLAVRQSVAFERERRAEERDAVDAMNASIERSRRTVAADRK